LLVQHELENSRVGSEIERNNLYDDLCGSSDALIPFHTIFQGWEWLGLALLHVCDSVILFEAPSPENLSTVFEFILKGFDALGMKDTWIKW